MFLISTQSVYTRSFYQILPLHSFYTQTLAIDNWVTASLTFHCILHILGKEVPHDLSADLPRVQLLGKPGRTETDSNHTHFRIKAHSSGWPNGRPQTEILVNNRCGRGFGWCISESILLQYPELDRLGAGIEMHA